MEDKERLKTSRERERESWKGQVERLKTTNGEEKEKLELKIENIPTFGINGHCTETSVTQSYIHRYILHFGFFESFLDRRGYVRHERYFLFINYPHDMCSCLFFPNCCGIAATLVMWPRPKIRALAFAIPKGCQMTALTRLRLQVT